MTTLEKNLGLFNSILETYGYEPISEWYARDLSLDTDLSYTAIEQLANDEMSEIQSLRSENKNSWRYDV